MTSSLHPGSLLFLAEPKYTLYWVMQIQQRFILTSIFIYFLLALVLVQAYTFLGNELETSLRLTGANALLMVVPVYGAYAAFRYYQPPEKIWLMALLLSGTAGCGVAWLALSWSQVTYAEELVVTATFNGLILPTLTYAGLVEGKYRRASAHKLHQQRLEQLRSEAELQKFKQQLQPHFLFNSLNSISALVGKSPKEAREMIEKLAAFFRATLELQNQEESTLAAEVDVIKKYLAIEEVRFSHRLQIVWKIQNDALTARLPPLLLQPLVENAIKFGLYGSSDQVELQFMAELKNQNLVLTISNPFHEQVHLPGMGHGLKLIKERLYGRYLRQDLLQTSKENNLFVATLILPQ